MEAVGSTGSKYTSVRGRVERGLSGVDLPRGVRGRARETCAIFHHYADTMVGLAGSYVLLFLLALLPTSPLIFLSSLRVRRVRRVRICSRFARTRSRVIRVSAARAVLSLFPTLRLRILRAPLKPNHFLPSFFHYLSLHFIHLAYM